METVAAFFGGNPFATPVGQRIEQATDSALSGENWALNMEICDLINELEDGPKDAVKAIKKRFQVNAGKNNAVVMYTLIVLEACVKNCGRRFHVHVCTKDFVQEMVKLIGPKNDPSSELQEKVLALIQSWADAFQHIPELQGVTQVYQELKSKGIEFPMTDLDTLAPIVTPQRSYQSEGSATVRPASAAARPAVIQRPQTAEAPQRMVAPDGSAPLSTSETMTLNSAQLTKLQRDLSIVEGNMTVLSEMLSELSPGQEHPTDLDLLRELYTTCRAMQQRLVELIDRVADDRMTAHLLKINDDLNNLFLRYDRYEKNRQAISRDQPNPQPQPRAAAAVEPPSLIDLDDLQPSASAAAAALPTITTNTQGLGEENEFDMFAQSRTVTYESSKKNTSSYADPDQVTASLGQVAQQRKQEGGLFGNDVFQGVKEEDIAEMEAWLDKKSPDMEEDATLTPAMKEYLRKRSAAAAAAAAAAANSSTSEDQAHSRKPDNDPSLFSL